MADRKPIPREIELGVLDGSRRRCALCFHLKGDLNEKHGQIAHLDQNPANYAEDNLAFLCMEHHSVFDSRTSQHKNYTISEAKAARARLYQAIAQDKHLNIGQPSVGVETDRKTLEALIEKTSDAVAFLRDANFAAEGFSWSETEGLDRFLAQSRGPEHEFINPELETLQKRFMKAGQWQCQPISAPLCRRKLAPPGLIDL